MNKIIVIDIKNLMITAESQIVANTITEVLKKMVYDFGAAQ